jgi:hypothetical protein
VNFEACKWLVSNKADYVIFLPLWLGDVSAKPNWDGTWASALFQTKLPVV